MYVSDYVAFKKYFKNSSFFCVTNRYLPTCSNIKDNIITKMNLNFNTMKTLTFELKNNIFNEFLLLNEEMINVRGGGDEGGDPIVLPSPPPPII